MKSYINLLESNSKLVQEKLNIDPEFYKTQAKGQSPNFLWIGCSDSRVPANEITGTEAGDIFVHRNIANLVVKTDLNALSVLQYAVEYLKVKHVIVCGHYGCGGVEAAISNKDYGQLNKWLGNIKDVYSANIEELDSIEDTVEKNRRLVELNVIQQVTNLAKTTIIQKEWKSREVQIHGWVYELATGKIKDLGIDINSPADLPHMYQLNFD